MALQATVTLIGFTAVTATAAMLSALVVLWWAVVVMWWALVVRRWPLPCAHRHVEAGPTDLDLGIDFDDFLAQIGHCCDVELDALCESDMDNQSAKVLQDLEDECGGGPVGPQARRQLTNAEPRLDLEALQAKFELHRDVANVELRRNGTARD
jgi:hypothetical protein